MMYIFSSFLYQLWYIFSSTAKVQFLNGIYIGVLKVDTINNVNIDELYRMAVLQNEDVACCSLLIHMTFAFFVYEYNLSEPFDLTVHLCCR